MQSREKCVYLAAWSEKINVVEWYLAITEHSDSIRLGVPGDSEGDDVSYSRNIYVSK